MKQNILEQFVSRVIDILVESRLDERIKANKDKKNAAVAKIGSDEYGREDLKHGRNIVNRYTPGPYTKSNMEKGKRAAKLGKRAGHRLIGKDERPDW